MPWDDWTPIMGGGLMSCWRALWAEGWGGHWLMGGDPECVMCWGG